MHAEKAAVPTDQGGCEGGLLVRIEHMREIERHADIREIHFLKGKERRRTVRHQAIGTRLVRLVFDADEAVWIVQGDLADALDLIRPELRIVGLKGIVEAILSKPQRHQIAASLPSSVNSSFGEFNRLAADRRIGIGESSNLEGWIRIVPHCETVHGEAEG